ncbi:MAG: [Fe-Fe] hydrogenase large subunit C-terminal domain-containing protein, partial [Oscillospiraceae bacterium]|nr:[Fe-Fe] hydrogenase large subunit C-terminal domain-containing protein [Oscillospiraceae bacterium]
RHCYKCLRNCDVKAISVINEQAHIMTEHCIHCGHCLEVCPQNAKTFASNLDKIKGFIRAGCKTVVSVAPAYLGVLDYESPGQIVDALLKLGFSEIRETAEGAALVTARYVEILKEGKMPNVISTCCPSINDLVEKYFPSLTPLLAPVVSPMIAHGRLIKQMYGKEVKTVFLGPCIAKKAEAEDDERVAGVIDAVFTFEELLEWLAEEKIELRECEDRPFANPDPKVNRLYPASGGVVKSVLCEDANDSYQKLHVDGLKSCMELFRGMEKGEVEGCFIEVNTCPGGCVKGPASTRWNATNVPALVKLIKRVPEDEKSEISADGLDISRGFAPKHFDDRHPSEEEIKAVLNSIGKFSREDELDCGACGYASCRDKAIAVIQGKAELNMCLPYALTQAESMANVVMDTAPDLIFIVDQQLRIKECSPVAQKVLGLSHSQLCESYIFEYFDEASIARALDTKKSRTGKRIYVKDLDMTFSERVVYIEAMDCVLVLYRDITKEEKDREQRQRTKAETMEMAQRVIDKQMMVAQEIAGLLGETTAETKATLTKLRSTVLSED